MTESGTKQSLQNATSPRLDEPLQPVSAQCVAQKTYHFIGVGGIGMSGLAKLLIKNGDRVTGSDHQPGKLLEELAQLGADIEISHSPENLTLPLDAVVISAAIKPDNAELVFAGKNGCKVYKYAEMLGRIMDDYRGIAFCGTHGKSTTSAWLAFVLKETLPFSPSFIIGANVPQLGGSSGTGRGDYFVAEACEYDRSFLNLHPEIACILNIEPDHLDYYKDEDEIVEAFTDFASGIRAGGTIIANGSDPNVAKVLDAIDKACRCITFGLDPAYDFSARNIELVDGLYHFDVYHDGDPLGRTQIALPGRHNIYNALAVIATALTAGAPAQDVLRAISLFTGVDRRCMLKAKIGQITILDDYAHHPTEITASLSAIRQRYQPRRIWCVFQPHQYSRTRFLLDDFAESFKLADITIVPQIYFVRDTLESTTGVSAAVLVERIRRQGSNAVFIDDFDLICEHLKTNVEPGDLVVTMGAGDIWKIADEYIQWLGTNS